MYDYPAAARATITQVRGQLPFDLANAVTIDLQVHAPHGHTRDPMASAFSCSATTCYVIPYTMKEETVASFCGTPWLGHRKQNVPTPTSATSLRTVQWSHPPSSILQYDTCPSLFPTTRQVTHVVTFLVLVRYIEVEWYGTPCRNVNVVAAYRPH